MSQLSVAAPEYLITILNGPEKGSTFKIMSGRISIGRGTDNDISLSYDAKSSRSHAWITVTSNGVEITDVSDKNKIIVNGDDSPKQMLRDKSVIQLGETKMQFRVMSPKSDALNSLAVQGADFFKSKAMGLKRDSMPSPSRGRSSSRSAGFPKQNIIVITIIALVGFYYWSKPAAVSKMASAIRTEDQIVRDISSIEAETAKLQADRASRGENAPNFNEVNSHYIRGYRDYRSGNYQRAVESFQACLSIKPDHPKCQQFLSASSRGFWSTVDAEILRGLKLKEQNQYISCTAAFENVKNLVTDQTNKKYIEAETNRKFCDEKAKDRF
ncbi:MAG: FHA domain-containing protein [Bdellovibrionota bacterium]